MKMHTYERFKPILHDADWLEAQSQATSPAKRAGREEIAPERAELEDCPEDSTLYVIRVGESLAAIAEANNTTVEEIVAVNPDLNPYFYRAGDVICVPKPGRVSCLEMPAAQCPESNIRYTVVQGDTYPSIARKFQVTVEQLLINNPLVNPNTLQAGIVLCIPNKETQPTPAQQCPEGYRDYTVGASDTLSTILLEAQVSYGALEASNGEVNLANLHEGDTLCLPPEGSRAGCEEAIGVYVIRQGDTLNSLASAFSVGISDLMRVNPVLTPDDFIPGRLVCIPAST